MEIGNCVICYQKGPNLLENYIVVVGLFLKGISKDLDNYVAKISLKYSLSKSLFKHWKSKIMYEIEKKS